MSRDIKTAQKLTRINELRVLMELFVKPLPSDSKYVERHRAYMKLEEELDEAVRDYFEYTGGGKLNVNGKYFG